MKKIFLLICISAAFLPFVSCQKQEVDLLPPSEEGNFTTWSEVFESFWNAMNYNYVFWDIDEKDWDEVYSSYAPRFEALRDYTMSTFDEAGELFQQMTSGLVDHHYLFALKSTEYYIYSQPAQIEILTRDYYHEAMDIQQLINIAQAEVANGRITQFSGAAEYVGDSYMVAMSYLIDNVAYIYFSGFLWTYLMYYTDNLESNAMYQVYRNFFDIIDNTPGLKGVIIDVRNNGGGYLNDLNLLHSMLMSEPTQIMWMRTKNGLGRYDYGPWTPCMAYPAEDSRRIQVPLVQLVDLNSVSMSEMTSLLVKELPNGTVIGERTYGGLGALMGNFDYSYTGEVENASYWIYTTTTMGKDMQGNRVEGIGVIPDVEVLFDRESFMAGTDVQLEAALDYIESGQ